VVICVVRSWNAADDLPVVVVPVPTKAEDLVSVRARDGRSQLRDWWTALFISSKTVEFHLHKTFTTFGIKSRHQDERVLRRD
jgi:hypothetical protein